MKLIALCLLVMVAVGYAHPIPGEKSDSYDVDETLGNRRLLVPYLKCVLEQGKCTANMKDMKSDLEKAITFKCAECTEREKSDTRKIIRHLINYEEDYWNQIVAKYDHNREASVAYEKEFRGTQLKTLP